MLNTGRSDLRFFARKMAFLQACLGVRPTLSCKMRRNFFSPPLGKSQNVIEKNEGLSLVDTNFAPRDSPPVTFFGPCHPLLLVMGFTMIPNIHYLTR